MAEDTIALKNDFLTYIAKERNYSAHTLKSYDHDLTRFLTFMKEYLGSDHIDLSTVDKQTIRHFLGHEFEAGFSSRTVARRLAALKSLYKYLLRSENVNQNPTLGIKSPRLPKSLPNYIPGKLIDDLMDAPATDNIRGLRDRAVLELFYSTGMRLSELVGLNHGDVDCDKMMVKVTGKGNKQRLIPFGRQAKNSLELYLRERGKKTELNNNSEPLFIGNMNRRISVRTIQHNVRNYLLKVGEGKNLGPHTLRHTFATHLLDKGADIRSVKDLLGHSSLSSTQVYTHLQPDRMRKIYRQAHPHGSKK